MASVVDESAMLISKGEFEQARELLLNDLSEGGQGGPAVYSNLARAHYELDDLPRAVADLRHAHRLAPRSSSVQHDLAFVRSELDVSAEPVSSQWMWMEAITAGELGVFSCMLLGFSSLLLVVRRRKLSVGGVSFWVLSAALYWIALLGLWAVRLQPIAVIVDEAVVLRDSPAVAAGERHRLEPGTEVAVEQSYGRFVLVRDGLGRRGWASVSAVYVPWPLGGSINPMEQNSP